MKQSQFAIFILVLSMSVISFGQEKTKPAILVEMSAEKATSSQDAKLLHEKILSGLINSKRFNVIDRSPEMLKALENELAMKDLLNEETMIRLGKLSGARYRFITSLLRFSNEQKATENRSGNMAIYSYTATASGVIKIADLETAKYEQAISADTVITSGDRQRAMNLAMDAVVAKLLSKIMDRYPLSLQVVAINGNKDIVLNKGFEDGVRIQSTFRVHAGTSKGVVLKVTSVSANEAKARLIEGSLANLSMGDEVSELRTFFSNSVTISSQRKALVTLDGGKNMGIKKGDVFSSSSSTKARPIKIYIKSSEQETSQGKILRGIRQVSPGLAVVEQPEASYRYKFAGASLKKPMAINIKPGASNGTAHIVNAVGEFDIETGYLSNFKPITDISIYSVTLGSHNLARDLTTSFSIDIYRMTELNNWIGRLNVIYEHPLLPERLHAAAGISAGYGRLKQYVPEGVINTISKGRDSKVKSNSIFVGPVVGLSLTVKRFQLNANISYDYLRYKNWRYSLKVEDKEEDEDAPRSTLPYPVVDLSGLYFSGGIQYFYSR